MKPAIGVLAFGYWDNLVNRARLKLPESDVEDVVSEAIASAIVSAFDGSSVGEFRSWLHTILSRRIADYHEARSRRPKTAPLPGEDAPLDTLVDEAVRVRPDVAAKIAQLRAQDLTNKATAGRYGPALAASTGLTYNGRNIDGLVWNWSGGFSLAWPIFEGGLVRASVREGNAQSASLRAEIDIARQQVRVDVDQARLTIIAGKAAIAAAERSLANAKARLDLAELRYRTGVGNGIELSDAQLAATSAGFQLLQATLKLDTARAQLVKALGRS